MLEEKVLHCLQSLVRIQIINPNVDNILVYISLCASVGWEGSYWGLMLWWFPMA